MTMKKIAPEELKGIIAKHGKWLRGEDGGKRANLSAADLRAANLSAADLSAADLRAADLSAADLSAADLRAANLSAADLRDADLRDADLRAADLRAANLSAADLRDANLSDANLSDADLSDANLSAADLSDADLSAANLSAADLRDADLSAATMLPDYVAWKDYIENVVPALLQAGGKSLEAVLSTGCWECHKWENCPMHEAFGADSVDDVPPLYREQARRFVQLFDAGLIPKPVVGEAMADAGKEKASS